MTGYIMIDFAGLDLTADTSEAAITKTGLFAAASAAIDTNKPIYITGAVNGLKGACTPIQAFGNKLIMRFQSQVLTLLPLQTLFRQQKNPQRQLARVQSK